MLHITGNIGMVEFQGKFHDKILDVRKVLEEPLERQSKSIDVNGGIEGDDLDQIDLTDLNEVIINENEEPHNDPVLDVISAFFGHDIENITNVHEAHEEIVNNDIAEEIADDDNSQQLIGSTGELKSGPRKAKLFRDGRVFDVPGGLDFTNAVFNEKLGKLCMEKEEQIESIEKKPILECNHK